ncbi:MAG: CPBP family intramembrane glutamic endopeptidase [Candidatus Promineifilaceae bacterium]|nr:CPBP family intramembrane glutamic endopeptidase [Candidatus Promineifilaceae bacterium]
MAQQYEQLPFSKLLFLHLFPGAAIAFVFIILAYSMQSSEMPAVFWFFVAIPMGMIPTELGYLLYKGRKRNGHFSLHGILAYQNPLSWKQYLWTVPVTFLSMLILLTLAGTADSWFYTNIFGWLPSWLNIELLDAADISKPLLLIVAYLFNGLLGPIIEELYFRGYLLPRMSAYGRWADLLHTFLFAIYHFWSPWRLIQRTIGVLPLPIAAKRSNLNVAIITHVLLNTIGFTLTISGVLAATS